MKQYKILFYILFFFCYVQIHAEDKKIAVVIPSYNNEKYCISNLESVFRQTYKNYIIIYLDDCSTDETYQKIITYVYEKNMQDKVIIISNKKRQGALYNHYKAVHLCDEETIIVNLDGDDWLAHEVVLEYINMVYQNPNVWMTWGSYIEIPSKKIGTASKELQHGVVQLNAFRETDYVTSHLRTFYAGLFKQIKLQDLLLEHSFFTAACDVAFMMPMLEMSRGHAKYIPHTLYSYNLINPSSHHNKYVLAQQRNQHIIRGKKKYKKLNVQPWSLSKLNTSQLDACIIASDIIKLKKTIQSLQIHTDTVNRIFILHSFDNETVGLLQGDLEKKDLKIKSNIILIQIGGELQAKAIFNMLFEQATDYLLFSTDSHTLAHNINLPICMTLLEQTKAYCFATKTERSNVDFEDTLTSLSKKICAYKFSYAPFEYAQANKCNMRIYKTQKLQKQFAQLPDTSAKKMIKFWKRYPINPEAIGLIYKTKKDEVLL